MIDPYHVWCLQESSVTWSEPTSIPVIDPHHAWRLQGSSFTWSELISSIHGIDPHHAWCLHSIATQVQSIRTPKKEKACSRVQLGFLIMSCLQYNDIMKAYGIG